VDNLAPAMKQAELNFPIVVDNERQNWIAWGNTMWPRVYLIDKEDYVQT